MRIGLLWNYSKSNKEQKYNLKEIILEAAEYYEKKYGYKPDTCYLNLNSEKIENILDYNGNKINILKNKSISPKNLWIGTEEEKERSLFND